MSSCGIFNIRIEDTGTLSTESLAQLNDEINVAEDLRVDGLLVNVVGRSTPIDLLAWPGVTDIHTVNKWERTLRRIERISVTTAVLVEKACSIFALEILLVADRRVARDDFLLQQSTLSGEVWPGMSLYRLSRQVGEARTRKLLLDCMILSAAEAEELSIVDTCVSSTSNDLTSFESLLKSSRSRDFWVRRKLMQEGTSADFDNALGSHLAACDRMLRRFKESADNKAMQQGSSSL